MGIGLARHKLRISALGIGSAALVSAIAFGGSGLEAAPRDQQGVAADNYRDLSSLSAETNEQGDKIWTETCAACHDTGVARAPAKLIIQQMTPEAIYKVLTTGIMAPMAASLDDSEKKVVSEYLAGRPIGAANSAPVPQCEGAKASFDTGAPTSYPFWGVDAGNTHFVPADMAGIDAANVGDLKLKWALAIPNATRVRSQPAFAGGAVIFGGQDNQVRALDEETGCLRWSFESDAEVRTGITVQSWDKDDADANPLAFFGDVTGNAYAIEAFTGKQVWKISADDHASTTLTGAPTYYDATLYIPVSSLEEGAATTPGYPCCTFRGSLLAVDAATGEEKWRTYLIEEPKEGAPGVRGNELIGPSGVPIWSAPTIDAARGRIYVATGDNYTGPATDMSDSLVAIDMATGNIDWHFQALENDAWNGSCEEAEQSNCPEEDGPDYDFGVNPVLAKTKDGKDMILLGQKSGAAFGVDPDTGEMVWKTQVGRGGIVGGIHFGMAAVDGVLFVPVSDVPDGQEYEMEPRPGMYALDIATGDYVWQAKSEDVCEGRSLCYPGYSGAISATPNLVFAGSNDGHVRAFSAADGKVLWDIDTTVEYTGVNGEKGHGGSFSGGSAPMPHKGMLFITSGYGFSGKMPGNMFLAYGVKEDAGKE